MDSGSNPVHECTLYMLRMSVPCTCSAATDFKSTISSVKSSQRFAACLGITLGGLGLITQFFLSVSPFSPAKPARPSKEHTTLPTSVTFFSTPNQKNQPPKRKILVSILYLQIRERVCFTSAVRPNPTWDVDREEYQRLFAWSELVTRRQTGAAGAVEGLRGAAFASIPLVHFAKGCSD